MVISHDIIFSITFLYSKFISHVKLPALYIWKREIRIHRKNIENITVQRCHYQQNNPHNNNNFKELIIVYKQNVMTIVMISIHKTITQFVPLH